MSTEYHYAIFEDGLRPESRRGVLVSKTQDCKSAVMRMDDGSIHVSDTSRWCLSRYIAWRSHILQLGRVAAFSTATSKHDTLQRIDLALEQMWIDAMKEGRQ